MSLDTHHEYRAVFRSPYAHGGPDEYGRPVRSLDEAKKQRPPRSEENHAYVAGYQVRVVSEWGDAE